MAIMRKCPDHGIFTGGYCPGCHGTPFRPDCPTCLRAPIVGGVNDAQLLAASPRLPDDSEARKAMPMFSGLIAYFPLALAAVAKHSKDSNDKHNPGEPLHWSREKSSDHLDCIIRHLADRALAQAQGDRAEVLYHQCAIAWRALAQLELDEENSSV